MSPLSTRERRSISRGVIGFGAGVAVIALALICGAIAKAQYGETAGWVVVVITLALFAAMWHALRREHR